MMRTLSLIVLALVAAAPAAAQHRVADTRPLQAGGYFKILLVDGSIRVRAWDKDSVRVTGTMDAAARKGFYFGAGGSAGKMGIESSGGAEAELEVSLPRGVALWVKTTAGAIEVNGMDGSLDLYSVTGDVRVQGSPRSLYAESMAGKVVVEGSPRTVRVKTGSGAVTFNGGSPDLDLSTVSGALTIGAVAPLRRATLETVGGRIVLFGAIDRGGVVTIRSHDGPVELVLPPGSDADFLLATLDGSLSNRLTDGSMRKSSGLKGRELTFTSGRGGAEVTVRTFSGAITVRPAEES